MCFAGLRIDEQASAGSAKCARCRHRRCKLSEVGVSDKGERKVRTGRRSQFDPLRGSKRTREVLKTGRLLRNLHGKNPRNASGSKSVSNSTGNPAIWIACCHSSGEGIAVRRR